jgi:polyisoprenoid-binding protein YceI
MSNSIFSLALLGLLLAQFSLAKDAAPAQAKPLFQCTKNGKATAQKTKSACLKAKGSWGARVKEPIAPPPVETKTEAPKEEAAVVVPPAPAVAKVDSIVTPPRWSAKGTSTATFTAAGPAGLKIAGETTALKVKDDGKDILVTVALKEIDTGVGLRNRHMCEDLGCDTFPDITLAIPSEKLKAFENGKTFETTTPGVIGLHGRTKEVPVQMKVSCQLGACAVSGSAAINLDDYGVKIRSYLGITVKPNIGIGAKLTLTAR